MVVMVGSNMMGDGGLWGWYGFCVCFLNCSRQVVVQLI